MPLLRRQPFVPQLPPPDLRPDEEVFFCPLTKEIFRDFEYDFASILCQLLCWNLALPNTQFFKAVCVTIHQFLIAFVKSCYFSCFLNTMFIYLIEPFLRGPFFAILWFGHAHWLPKVIWRIKKPLKVRNEHCSLLVTFHLRYYFNL